uniref:Adipolin n=1 Tax=Latimeria chalumnae TaxID=7897 RepID=H3AV85_LATCH
PSESLPMDPYDTWLMFREQSNKGVNKRERGKHHGNKSKHGPPGPTGPPGPQGPAGPPGALITQEELLQEFKRMLKDALERRRLGRCPHCKEKEERVVLDFIAGQPQETGMYPRLGATFHCKLRDNLPIERRKMVQLHNFQIPENEEQFQRGSGFNVSSGQYTVPVSGFYSLTASLHYVSKHWENPRRGYHRARDHVRALICIGSLCQHNMSLETVKGLESSSEYFTVLVTGTLFLQMGQYVSVFVDNVTGSTLVIRSGSDFTGVLLGI